MKFICIDFDIDGDNIKISTEYTYPTKYIGMIISAPSIDFSMEYACGGLVRPVFGSMLLSSEMLDYISGGAWKRSVKCNLHLYDDETDTLTLLSKIKLGSPLINREGAEYEVYFDGPVDVYIANDRIVPTLSGTNQYSAGAAMWVMCDTLGYTFTYLNQWDGTTLGYGLYSRVLIDKNEQLLNQLSKFSAAYGMGAFVNFDTSRTDIFQCINSTGTPYLHYSSCEEVHEEYPPSYKTIIGRCKQIVLYNDEFPHAAVDTVNLPAFHEFTETISADGAGEDIEVNQYAMYPHMVRHNLQVVRSVLQAKRYRVLVSIDDGLPLPGRKISFVGGDGVTKSLICTGFSLFANDNKCEVVGIDATETSPVECYGLNADIPSGLPDYTYLYDYWPYSYSPKTNYIHFTFPYFENLDYWNIHVTENDKTLPSYASHHTIQGTRDDLEVFVSGNRRFFKTKPAVRLSSAVGSGITINWVPLFRQLDTDWLAYLPLGINFVL